MLFQLIKINGNLLKILQMYCRPPSTYQSNTLHKNFRHKNFRKMAHLLFNSKMFSEAMLRILQHLEKRGWIAFFWIDINKKWSKKNTNVMSNSEGKPKLSLRDFADDKAVSFTVQDLTCWYSWGLSAEFSIIVWTMVIIGSFSFIYFKSGGAYSKHQFTA